MTRRTKADDDAAFVARMREQRRKRREEIASRLGCVTITEHRFDTNGICECCGAKDGEAPYLCDKPDVVSLLHDLADNIDRSLPKYHNNEPSVSTALEYIFDLAAIVRRLATDRQVDK